MAALNLTQSNIQTALRSFLLSILPTGWQVFEGQDSRVSEPSGTDFVIMTPILRERLETNIVGFADCVFTGSISGTTLTVSAMRAGTILAGSNLWGVYVTAGTTIVSQTSGTIGGVGVYVVLTSQTVASAELAAGNITVLMPTMVTVQLDIHSANVGDSSDAAQLISTLFRDGVAVDAFSALGYKVTPLYADDPRQAPYQNAEQNYETRWVVSAVLQANQSTSWPMQFADGATVTFEPLL